MRSQPSRPILRWDPPAPVDTGWDMLDRRAVQALFGGIHAATLYRHVRNGLIPRPVKIGALSRWVRAECHEALAAMVAGRAS